MAEKVLIIGAGFAGIRAARALRDTELDVLLIDRQNYHLFQPLLYQVATASLEQESIAYPARSLARRFGDNINFRLTEVLNIDLDEKVVYTTTGPIPYDKLVIAAGAVTNFFGNENVERYSYQLKDLDDAVQLRNRVLYAFERASQIDDPVERASWLTFTIVGGGPTGLEFAGALSELVESVISRDYPEFDALKEVKIILLEAMDRLLLPYTPRLGEYAKRRLENMGVDVRLNTFVVDAGPSHVELKGGEVINSRTLLWAAGVKASPLVGGLNTEKGKGGRLVVNDTLNLPNYPDVYAVGDIVQKEQDGEYLPGMAPVAMQMGEYAGHAIAQRSRGKKPKPFYYKDKGKMSVIGRGIAVADVFGMKIAGPLAWLMWLALHIYYLVDFRNRVLVMLNWGYDYLLFQRKVRLILQRTDTNDVPAIEEVAEYNPNGASARITEGESITAR